MAPLLTSKLVVNEAPVRPSRPTWNDYNRETFTRGYGPIRVDLRGLFAVLSVEILARELDPEVGIWLLGYFMAVPDCRLSSRLSSDSSRLTARLSAVSPWPVEPLGVPASHWTRLQCEDHIRRDVLQDEFRALRQIHKTLHLMMQHEVDEAIYDSTGAQPFDPHRGDRELLGFVGP